jgi:tetratricopeptide (TPR) repeat protein
VRYTLWLFGVPLVLTACATATPSDPPMTAKAPTVPLVTPPAPAPPAAPSAQQRLVAEHREQARQLEQEGALRRALEQWKIALTIDPADAAALAGRARLEARIEGLVAERIAAGRAALARGSQVEARRRFAAALALDPGNRIAFEALQNEVRDVEFLTHTVRAGDSLASLAQQYYGDRSRSEVIWETNQLPPNPKLAVGTTLKIPEIPGVPFVRPDTRREATPVVARPEVTTTRAEPAREEHPPEVNPLLADARDAFERKDYVAAVSDVDKFLGGNPGNREALDLKKQALYTQGKTQFEQRKYDESYQALAQLAKLQPNYEDGAKLLQQARVRVVERHYSEGIRLFREEKLPEAVAEWRIVLALDPQHANAKRNIDQAERLLRGLDERKKR